MNEDFDAITNGLELDVPEIDGRRDGIYFHAINDGAVTYQDVLEGRVVMLVKVDTAVTMDPPASFINAGYKLAPGISLHPITVCKPDGSDCVVTDGFTVKLPGSDRIINGAVHKYIKANTIALLVRLYSLGV